MGVAGGLAGAGRLYGCEPGRRKMKNLGIVFDVVVIVCLLLSAAVAGSLLGIVFARLMLLSMRA
jgi:hypothetical protein